ncbi:uncharacterized protein LOC141663546 isoform X2 [Apium graveolens]|uniref:uncharacterized protein LOC141663546 isoform X2 n=1 Tax=Apium graveolens TaxID=4045 RepID=UPI003D798840
MARHYSRRTLQLTRVQMVGVKNKTPEVQSKLTNALVVDVNKNQVIAAGIVSILSSPTSSKSTSLVSAMPTSLLSVKTFTLAEMHKSVSSDRQYTRPGEGNSVLLPYRPLVVCQS